MNKSLFSLILAGAFTVAGIAEAATLGAELIMPGGRSWKGAVVSRDGDWIEFSTGAKPIRVGANTIEELIFDIRIDDDKLYDMSLERDYDQLIATLNKALEPYSAYSDIPSNLARYNVLLMEMYYITDNYDKAISLASKVVSDERDEKLLNKSRIFHVLSLIDSGRMTEAEALMPAYGWKGELGLDASPAELYVTAKLFSMKKDYAAAMELAAKVVAFNSQDPDWMQPAELLCAQVYAELGMYDSAEEVIRQISLLYKNTYEDDLAQQLKVRIDGLRAEQSETQSLESE